MQKPVVFLTSLFTTAAVRSVMAEAKSRQARQPQPVRLGGGKTIKVDYSSPRMKGRKISVDSCPSAKCGAPGRTRLQPS